MDKFYMLSTNIPSKFYLLSGKFLKYPKKNSEITFSLWDTEIDLGGNGLGEPGDTQAVFRSVWLDVYLYLCIGLTQRQCLVIWLPPATLRHVLFCIFCICICICLTSSESVGDTQAVFRSVCHPKPVAPALFIQDGDNLPHLKSTPKQPGR